MQQQTKQEESDPEEWQAEEAVHLQRTASTQEAQTKTEPAQVGDQVELSANAKVELGPDDDLFPPGFIEQLEELEEKLKHPPPHDEIIRQLRKSGWWGRQYQDL